MMIAVWNAVALYWKQVQTKEEPHATTDRHSPPSKFVLPYSWPNVARHAFQTFDLSSVFSYVILFPFQSIR
jgi:hypothetical protein